jgi:hypothetical protein
MCQKAWSSRAPRWRGLQASSLDESRDPRHYRPISLATSTSAWVGTRINPRAG